MRRFHIPLTLPLLVLLTSCSDVKSRLGLYKTAPDEFTIVSRPNLQVPQSFDLPPPGAMVAHEPVKAHHAAHHTVTPGELALLHEIKVKDTNKLQDARNQIDSDYANTKNKRSTKGVLRRTVENLNSTSMISIIDPAKEAERLEENRKQSKKINEGKVPTKNADKATIDRIFGTELFS